MLRAIVQREDPGTARRGCRFDSGWLHRARADQRRDRRADIPETAGSIPAVRTDHGDVVQREDAALAQR